MADIPKNPRSNCYFECKEGGPLHHFPKLRNDKERFNVWKAVLNDDIQVKGDMYIYNQLRLCNRHFENYYISPSNRLTRNAVPTLFIKKEISYHCWPNYVKYPERFKEWVRILGGKLETDSDYERYMKLLVCDIHFAAHHKNRNNRINACAVPLLYLCGTGDTILHTFPNPDNDLERYSVWALAVGMDTTLDPRYVYKNRRVCHDHFEKKFMTWTSRLSPNAVPTLLLTGPALTLGGNVTTYSSEHTYCTVRLENVEVPEIAIQPKYNEKHLPGMHKVLHRFPNPDKYKERYDVWLKAIGGDILRLETKLIVKYRRVCHVHFEEKYICRYNRLSKIAVPTLNLADDATLISAMRKDSEPIEADQALANEAVSGVSGQVIKKSVSSLTAPELDVSSDTNEIVTEFLEDDVTLQEFTTDNMSSVSIDKELSTEPESSHTIIARVYKYLKKEYEYMKSVVGDSCDLSPMADILRRTAEATGVTEDTVTSIVEESESQSAEHHVTDEQERWSNLLDNQQQNIDEVDADMKLNDLLDIKCEPYTEDSVKMDMSDDVYILDLRDKATVKEENQNIGSPNKNTKLPLGLIKAHFVAGSVSDKSVLSESDRNISDISKNLLSCRWCIIRRKGYNKNMWMCRQCKVVLGLSVNKCFKNCHRVP